MTKKIRVTDVFGSPLYGAYVYHEGEVSATDKNGYVTITVDDPYSLIKITHVSGVPVEIPFVDLPKFLVLEPESLDTVVINGSKKKTKAIWWAVAGVATALLILTAEKHAKKITL